MTLREGNVALRPIDRRDRDAWTRVRAVNREWLAPWEATPPRDLGPPVSFAAMVRMLRAQARRGQQLPFVVTSDGELVGQLTVGGITYGSLCSAHIGYWVDSRVAGRGVIPTALALAVDHAFGAGGLHRVEINIRPENTPSRRVVEKLGFREEAYHPRYMHIDGQWRDHLGYAMTTEEIAGEGGLVARWRRLRTTTK